MHVHGDPGVRTKNWTLEGNMYSEEEIRKALEVCKREGSLRKAIKALGYPSIPIYAVWVRRQKAGKK